MSKIKTRETVRDIKALDKVAAATHHVKDAYVRTKDSAERTQVPDHDSPSGYAIDRKSASFRCRSPPINLIQKNRLIGGNTIE